VLRRRNPEDPDGERMPIEVNSLGGSEKQAMQSANLWFSTDNEAKRYGQMLSEELDALKDELKPIVQAINQNEKHKNN
jgi:hypothetical protein